MNFRLFDKSVYTARRKALCKNTGSGLILIPGNDEVGMNYRDNWFPYRQDSTFLYYFGLNTAGLNGVIDADSGQAFIFGGTLFNARSIGILFKWGKESMFVIRKTIQAQD